MCTQIHINIMRNKKSVKTHLFGTYDVNKPMLCKLRSELIPFLSHSLLYPSELFSWSLEVANFGLLMMTIESEQPFQCNL